MGRKLDFCLIFVGTAALLAGGCAEETKEVTSLTGTVGFNHMEGYLAAPPAIDGDFIYASTGSGAVRKLNKATGRIEWTFDKVGGYVNNSPVVTGAAVLVMGSEGKLVAIDKETGEKQWERAAAEWTIEGEAIDAPGVAGCMGFDPEHDLVILGDEDGRVLALDPADGSIKWHRELQARILAPPVFGDDIVFIGSMGGRLHALSLADGTNRWELPKVLVAGVEGTIPEKTAETGGVASEGYSLTVKYKYNFDPDDYFGHEDEAATSNIEIVLLDAAGSPIKCIVGDEEHESIKVSGIDPSGHLSSGSQTQKKIVFLAEPPGAVEDWPVTVSIKDHQGAVIDSLATKVTFNPAKTAEAKPQAQ